MAMLNKVHHTLSADYRITRNRLGKYEAYVRPMGEGWMYLSTHDDADEAFQAAETTAEECEIMSCLEYEYECY